MGKQAKCMSWTFSSFSELDTETPHLQKDFPRHSFLTWGGAVCCLSSMPNWTGVMQMYVAALWNRGREAVLGSSRPLKQAVSRRADIPQQLGEITVSGTSFLGKWSAFGPIWANKQLYTIWWVCSRSADSQLFNTHFKGVGLNYFACVTTLAVLESQLRASNKFS